jgi:hypothetical protein
LLRCGYKLYSSTLNYDQWSSIYFQTLSVINKIFRVPQGVALEETINETKKMAELAFNLIVDSEQNFPGRLRSVCHALFHVINTRFPNSGLSALGKILFLRFFNPAIGTAAKLVRDTRYASLTQFRKTTSFLNYYYNLENSE